jgi:hypothetical protein
MIVGRGLAGLLPDDPFGGLRRVASGTRRSMSTDDGRTTTSESEGAERHGGELTEQDRRRLRGEDTASGDPHDDSDTDSG